MLVCLPGRRCNHPTETDFARFALYGPVLRCIVPFPTLTDPGRKKGKRAAAGTSRCSGPSLREERRDLPERPSTRFPDLAALSIGSTLRHRRRSETDEGRCPPSLIGHSGRLPNRDRYSPFARRLLSAYSGEAKNTTALAISSDSPMRPIIANAAKRSSVPCQSVAPRPVSVMSVGTKPGATALTVMPCGPSSMAKSAASE
jgi:hypothetical protein